MSFFRKPKATIYTNPIMHPGYQTDEMRKRRKDEDCAARVLYKPIEAHPNHQRQHKIDRWDFISLGPSDKEQDLVAKILPKKKNAVGKDGTREEFIIRAGFSDKEPTRYCHFIATWITRDEIIQVSNISFAECKALN